MKIKPLYIQSKTTTIPITHEQLKGLLGNEDNYNTAIRYKKLKLDLKSNFKPFRIIKVKGLAMVVDKVPSHYNFYFYGLRNMVNVKARNFQLEGTVFIRGKKYGAFTSGVMFQLPNQTKISIEALYVEYYPRNMD